MNHKTHEKHEKIIFKEESFAIIGADFVCYNSILIEIKAVNKILDIHKAQILNYLKATNLKLGLLMNFSSHPKLGIDRFVL